MRFFKRPTRRELYRKLLRERDTLRKQRDALASHRNELVQSIAELSAERDTLRKQIDGAEATIAKRRTLLTRERAALREQLEMITRDFLGPK